MNACTQQFAETHLPSHDQWHHERVWKYAKSLIIQSGMQGMTISENDITRLMIAVFFHDQGMSETTSSEHGKISRKMCKAFIQKCNIHPPDFFEIVLDAVEYHDKKDYKKTDASSVDFDIHKFLNTADDLDAFGTIGVYRYLEIYLLRQMQVKAISEAVLSNMEGRYKHFKDSFGHCSPLVNAHYQRYLNSRNYFKDLDFQINRTEIERDSGIGPMGVLNCIKNEILEKKRSVMSVCQEITSTEGDLYCLQFFKRMQKEMDAS
jgi:hypothetical protein